MKRHRSYLADEISIFVVLTLWGFLGMALVVAASRCAMETDLTWREKRLERQIREDVEGADRFVDVGVRLRVVVADEDGEELIPGKPRLRVLREHLFGGLLDTRANPPRLVAGTRDPATWYCSEDQEAVLLHDDPRIPGQVIYGSEGAGKTHVLAMLHYLWWLDMVGEKRELGQSAPTKRRLKHVLRAMGELYPPAWFTYNKHDQVLTFCDGHQVQFLSTKRQSEAQGSPGQGYGWSGCGRDELQDQLDADEDLESRGRNAKIDPRSGTLHYRQAATCTAKQSSAFVSLVQRKLSSGYWRKRLLLIARSPFIHKSFLDEKRLVMTDREFRRRYGAEDLPPEHMLYFNWLRERNLRPIPSHATPITSLVLRLKTGDPRHALLVGNDPGISKAASIFLQAYELPGVADPVWWARAELVTFHATTETHAHGVLDICRDRFGTNKRASAEQAHVRSHPYGQAKDKPSLDVYRIFGRVGLNIRAAQYTKKGEGTGTIKYEDRIEMVNCLLLDAAGRTRLYVECDARHQPLCPKLVEAFETLERPVDSDTAPDEDKSLEHDKSDPPDALGNGLWAFEKEAVQQARVRARARGKAA